jgi:hypothetical protein
MADVSLASSGRENNRDNPEAVQGPHTELHYEAGRRAPLLTFKS